MKLKSFGCSFIFGTELQDVDLDGFCASNQTWPALLAKKLQLDYYCYARPGAGNLEITNAVLDNIVLNEPCMYVIAWSWPQRYSFRKNDQDGPAWDTLLPGYRSHPELNKIYFSSLQNDYSDKLNHLIQVQLVLNQLKSQPNSRFIMTYMDHLLLDPSNDTSSPGITMLQAQCSQSLSTFNGMNFLEWSISNEYSIGSRGHPLEAAHRAAAKYAHAHFLV